MEYQHGMFMKPCVAKQMVPCVFLQAGTFSGHVASFLAVN